MRLFGITEGFAWRSVRRRFTVWVIPAVLNCGFRTCGGALACWLLEKAANDLLAKAGTSPVVTQLNSTFRASVPQLYVDIDRVKAKSLGVPLSTIF